jgi:RNA polymerase sigma-70 factor (ECF subfamily)
MLLLPITTRANFCAMKFISFVVFEQLNMPKAFGPIARARANPSEARVSASSHDAGRRRPPSRTNGSVKRTVPSMAPNIVPHRLWPDAPGVVSWPVIPTVPYVAGPEPPGYEPGSHEDFDRLYRNSYQRIYRTMLAVLGDRAAAEDCTQDAFVLAFRAWARWRPDAPAEAWLHRIAINVAVSYHRKASLRSIGTILRRLGRPAAGPDPAQVALDRDLTDALRHLQPRLRAALVLRHYHGYNNREIAAAIGVSERTVNKRLRIASGRMRALLARDHKVFPLEGPGSLSSTEMRRSTHAKNQ